MPSACASDLRRLFETQRQYVSHFFEEVAYGSLRDFCQEVADCDGTVYFSGVGKSGFVAQKVSATMVSTGAKSAWLDPTDALRGDVGVLRANDVLVLFSKSGASDELRRRLPRLLHVGRPQAIDVFAEQLLDRERKLRASEHAGGQRRAERVSGRDRQAGGAARAQRGRSEGEGEGARGHEWGCSEAGASATSGTCSHTPAGMFDDMKARRSSTMMRRSSGRAGVTRAAQSLKSESALVAAEPCWPQGSLQMTSVICGMCTKWPGPALEM